jgi:hypothetical protein
MDFSSRLYWVSWPGDKECAVEAMNIFFKSIDLNSMRAALYAWLLNLLFSLVGFYGFFILFSMAAGESLAAGDGGKQYGIFNFLVDIFYNYKGSLVLLFAVLFLITILFVLVTIFSSGGIYAALLEERKAGFSNLFYCSAENFFSMLKMFLVNIVNWLAALSIPLFLMILYWRPGMLEVSEWLFPFFMIVWLPLTVAALIYSSAIYDFSRISRMQEGRNLLYSFKEGIKFAFTNKLTVLVLFSLYGIFLVILYLVYLLVSGPVGNLAYTTLIFVIYQVFMFLRYYLKVVLMQAEVKIAEQRFLDE